MGFHPDRGTYYRMPVFFGPTPGPRQWPEDSRFDPANQTTTIASTSFLTEADRLEPFLPHGFALWGPPVVTLDITYMRNIAWLAGRGYAMSDFKFRAVFSGKTGPVHGTFVLVRWESLADPIISGREELGHNKLFCDIPDLVEADGSVSTRLSWLGHVFADLELSDLVEAPPPTPDPLDRGQLNFKWVPKTGCPGEADAAYATLSAPNPGPSPVRLVRSRRGKGSFVYKPTRWEDFPFCHRVIDAIASLPVLGWRDATLIEMAGSPARPGENTQILE